MKSPMAQRLSMSILVIALVGCGDGGGERTAAAAAAPEISGRIDQGLRVLTFDPAAADQHFRIYRGDYVRPEVAGSMPFHLQIPDLGVDMHFPVAEDAKPYFKVPNAGTYAFTMGGATGVIEAVEYTKTGYRDVTAVEANRYLMDRRPLVLDVRTEREFTGGHLEGAVLIPVQVLQKRLGELAGDRTRPVLVYCRTGNRSTVAAKLLMDAGHEEVVNLRTGIVGWQRAGLPVVK